MPVVYHGPGRGQVACYPVKAMALRFDASPLTKVTRTPQGGLRVDAAVSRTGILLYTNPDGSTRREYRPPAEVFAPESLATIAAAPVTNLHPGRGRVDAEDWRTLAVGHVGESIRQDGDHVAATLYVQDRHVIDLIESGQRREVSLGYDLDYDPTPGTSPEGERYDGIQRNIRVNHVALVPKGRSGSSVALRLDGEGNQVCYHDHGQHVKETTHTMKITIGGKEYDMADPAQAKAAGEAATALQARADAAETATRVTALRAALAPLKMEFRADADEAGIMLEVLKKHAPGVAVEGASPEFILGAFSATLALKLGAIEAAASEEEAEPDDGAAPNAAPAPGNAPPARADAAPVKAGALRGVKASVFESRQERKDAESREDEDGPSPAEVARQKMVEAGRKRATA